METDLDDAFHENAERLGRLVRWIVQGQDLNTIGLRATALIVTMKPDAFEFCHRAKTFRATLKAHRSELATLARQVRTMTEQG